MTHATPTGLLFAVAAAVFVVAGCGGSDDDGAAADTPTVTTRATQQPGIIAYQTDRGGGEGVWLVGSDGSADHEVVTDLPGEHLHPDWSPDGKRLLFTQRAAKDLLFEADASGGSPRPIVRCDDPCIGDDEASYSPDGRRIAFIRALGPLVNDRPRDCALWTFDRATKKATRLTRHRNCTSREAFPRWAPDGKTLVFFRDRSDPVTSVTSTTAVFSRPASGGRERQLTPWELAAGDADWSPDGRSIVFSTYPLVYFQSGRVSNLYTMRADGSGRRRLTSHKAGGVRASHPRWTPDGTRIVYVTDTGRARELWSMAADGGDLERITTGGIYTHPAWKPGS